MIVQLAKSACRM